jgi:hypothetical protein
MAVIADAEIAVDWNSGGKCWGHSKQFALSWVPDGQNKTLSRDGVKLLETLLAETQRFETDDEDVRYGAAN